MEKVVRHRLNCMLCKNGVYCHDYEYPGIYLEGRFGYGSKNDGDTCLLRMCDECFEKIKDKVQTTRFLIKPTPYKIRYR